MNTDDMTTRAERRQGSPQPAGQTTQELLQELKDWQRQVTENARQAAQITDRYVRQNPWIAIGSVALSCFLLGVIVGRSGD